MITYTLPYYVVLVLSTYYLSSNVVSPQTSVSKTMSTNTRTINFKDEGEFVRICNVGNVTVILDGYTLYTLGGTKGCFNIYKLSRYFKVNGSIIRFLRVQPLYTSSSSKTTLYSSHSNLNTLTSVNINNYDFISIIALVFEVLRRVTALEAEDE